MEVILRIVENPGKTMALISGSALLATRNPKYGALVTSAFAGGCLTTFCASMVYGSYRDQRPRRGNPPPAAPVDWSQYFESDKLNKQYSTSDRIPMVIFVEAYLKGDVTLKMDFLKLMEIRHQVFTFVFNFGEHVTFVFKSLLPHLLVHSQDADRDEILPVYNLGNDFYECFLGKTMCYTCALFEKKVPEGGGRNPESLEDAQNRKFHTVCEYVHMHEAKTHLDIGCGWGVLCRYAAKNYNVKSTGVALASEQIAYCKQRAKDENNSAEYICTDYRDIPKGTKFDAITCLEMAEHVGIRNFQSFLLRVRDMLADDGIFYLQIAGLRRAWQYEDLVWGLFMDRYIFPGADASCPLAFVVTQLERSGFEVHRVENTGVHYAETIQHWYNNFQDNRETAVAKYGGWQARLWDVFLGWSTMIARQGSSTVFMVTCNKNLMSDARTHPTEALNRSKLWIGPRRLATQQ